MKPRASIDPKTLPKNPHDIMGLEQLHRSTASLDTAQHVSLSLMDSKQTTLTKEPSLTQIADHTAYVIDTLETISDSVKKAKQNTRFKKTLEKEQQRLKESKQPIALPPGEDPDSLALLGNETQEEIQEKANESWNKWRDRERKSDDKPISERELKSAWDQHAKIARAKLADCYGNASNIKLDVPSYKDALSAEENWIQSDSYQAGEQFKVKLKALKKCAQQERAQDEEKLFWKKFDKKYPKSKITKSEKTTLWKVIQDKKSWEDVNSTAVKHIVIKIGAKPRSQEVYEALLALHSQVEKEITQQEIQTMYKKTASRTAASSPIMPTTSPASSQATAPEVKKKVKERKKVIKKSTPQRNALPGTIITSSAPVSTVAAHPQKKARFHDSETIPIEDQVDASPLQPVWSSASTPIAAVASSSSGLFTPQSGAKKRKAEGAPQSDSTSISSTSNINTASQGTNEAQATRVDEVDAQPSSSSSLPTLAESVAYAESQDRIAAAMIRDNISSYLQERSQRERLLQDRIAFYSPIFFNNYIVMPAASPAPTADRSYLFPHLLGPNAPRAK